MLLYFKFTKKCPQYPSANLTAILSSDIVLNFKKNNPPNTKYKVVCGCKDKKCTGTVGLAANSEEELKKLTTTTRLKWPPNKVLQSAASDTSSSEDAIKSSKETAVLKAKKEREAKMSRLSVKLSKLSDSKAKAPSVLKQITAVSKSSTKRDNTVKSTSSPTSNKIQPAVLKIGQIQNASNASESIDPGTKKSPTIKSSVLVTKPTSVVKRNNPSDKEQGVQNEKESDGNDESGLILDYIKRISELELENKSLKSIILNMKRKNSDDNSNGDNIFNEETETLLRDFRRQIIKLEMENRSLKNSNIRMQNKVVDCFEQVHSSIKKVDITAQQELEKQIISGEKLEIGEVNPATNEIHAGHGVWIDRDMYDTIRFQPKINAQKFIKAIATAIFSNEVLKRSTVRGFKSEKSALSPVGLRALTDISKYWMEKVKKMDTSAVQKELRSITSYLNHKIADLNRDLTLKRKQSTKKDTNKSRKKQKTQKSQEFIENLDSNVEENDTNKPNAVQPEKAEDHGTNKGSDTIFFESVENRIDELDELDPHDSDDVVPHELKDLDPLELDDDDHEDEEDEGDQVNDFASTENEEVDDVDHRKLIIDQDDDEIEDERMEVTEGEVSNNDED